MIEEEKVGGACRAISEGYRLGFIKEVGEIPGMGRGESRHERGGILRVELDVVRVDRHGVNALSGEFLGQLAEGGCEMHDKWAVIGGKDNQSTVGAGERRKRVSFAERVRQIKERCRVSKLELER